MGKKSGIKPVKVPKGFNINKYAMPAVIALGIGVLVISGMAGDLSRIASPTSAPTTYESRLEAAVKEEKITFEMAKSDESLRQQYLNHIFANRDKYGVDGWDSFEGFVYDSEYWIVAGEFEKRTGKREWTGIEGYATEDAKPLILTPGFGMRSVRLNAFVSKYAFEFASSHDELLSLLDNEAFHAHLIFTGGEHFNTVWPSNGKMSVYLTTLVFEAYSFDKQFYQIHVGRRKVSQNFLEAMRYPASAFYKKIEESASQTDGDALFARAAINAMEQRPTLKYFK